MTARWREDARQVLGRIRSSPRLFVGLVVGVVGVGVLGGVLLASVVNPDKAPAIVEDDPEGFAEFLTEDEDDEETASRYLEAERALRAELAKQARLEQQGDDRALVLKGLGAAAQPWTWLGPRNFGGRTRALVVNPDDPNILLAGGITGGVWRSEDAGANWTAMTDTFSNIAINVLEFDPSNPQVVYAGTGEIYHKFFPAVRGNGIMKSTDGGISWAFLQSTVDNSAFDWVGDVEVSHKDPNRVYAATGTGVWVSGDGGQTWGSEPTHLSEHADDPFGVGCMELAIRTDRTPDVVFASCGYQYRPEGVLRSVDGGEHWESVLPVDGESIGFAALAIAPRDENTIYASVSGTNERAKGLYVSTTGGGPRSWSVRAIPDPADPTTDWLVNCRFPPETPEDRGQGGYDNVVAVDPTDPRRVWVGGIDLFRSEDGGETFQIASDWNADLSAPSYIHADQHAIVFDPAYDGDRNRTVYFGNDGGVYRTRDDRVDLDGSRCTSIPNIAYESLNRGYGTTQFIGGSVAKDGSILIGGTQDNGTYRYDAGREDWVEIWGGDGGNTAIDPGGNWFVVGWPRMELFRLTGPALLARCTDIRDCENIHEQISDAGGHDPETTAFYPPLEQDWDNPEILWTAGRSIWRTIDKGSRWSRVSCHPGDAETCDSARLFGTALGSAIGIAPSDSGIVYVGDYTGRVWMSRNALDAEPSWTLVEMLADDGLSAAEVSAIAIDPFDPTTVYVGIRSFDQDQLFRRMNDGPFEAIDEPLPDTPVNTIAINPLNPKMVYVGTDVGVFESLDGGDTWRVANENLATTIVNRLVFEPDSSVLYAFTFGRGLYRVDVGVQAPPVNDLFEAATEVVLAPDFQDAIDVRLASTSADDPELSCGSPLLPTQTQSVWYRFVAPSNGSFSATTAGSDFDTVVAVHEAGAFGALSEIDCNDDGIGAQAISSVLFQASATKVYYIEVTRSASSPSSSLADNLRLTVTAN